MANPLSIYLDAKPSEQIDGTNSPLCFSAVAGNMQSSELVDSEEIGFKGYKETPRDEKPEIAKKLAEEIKTNKVQVAAFSIVATKNGSFLANGQRQIELVYDELKMTHKKKKGSLKIKFNGKTFDEKVAIGISAYAELLPVIALRFIKMVPSLKGEYDELLIFFDNLPSEPAAGAELMQAISNASPEIMKMWEENFKGRNIKPGQIGNLGSFKDGKTGEIKPGKEYPLNILVDWVNASVMAKYFPEEIKKESNLNDEQIVSLASIVDAIEANKRFTYWDLEDPEFQRTISDHIESRLKGAE